MSGPTKAQMQERIVALEKENQDLRQRDARHLVNYLTDQLHAAKLELARQDGGEMVPEP